MSAMLDPEGEPIVGIEYQRAGKYGWQPHSVWTGYGTYDFDHCGTRGLWYNCSGSGSTPFTSGYCQPEKVCGKFWVAPGVAIENNGGTGDRHHLTAVELRKMGILLIAEPIGGNPFDPAEEGSTEWCPACRCLVPEEYWCRHVRFEEGAREFYIAGYFCSYADARAAVSFVVRHRRKGWSAVSRPLEASPEIAGWLIRRIIPGKAGGVKIGCRLISWVEVDLIIENTKK